jgi:hypothetical protein
LHYKIDKWGMTKYSCSIKARSKRSLEKNKRSKNKLEIWALTKIDFRS